MAAAPRGPSELARPPGTRTLGVRCTGPRVPGELSRCGPEARRRRAWTRADSRRRAAGRAGPEGVPPGRRAALCEPRGGKGRRAWRAGGGLSASGRPLCAIRSAPARLIRRGRASTGHTLGPAAAAGPLPESRRQEMRRGGRASPSASPGRRRGEVLPGRVPAPEAHVRRRAEEADSSARPGRRARSPPRKGF